MADMAEPLIDPDHDPYLWLEDVDGEESMAWVQERNRRAEAELMDSGFGSLEAELREILDATDRIPGVTRRVPRQVVGRISLVLNVGVVGSARPRCTSLGRFHEMASWGRSSLYSIR